MAGPLPGAKAQHRRGNDPSTRYKLVAVVFAASVIGILAGVFFKAEFRALSNILIGDPESQPPVRFTRSKALPRDISVAALSGAESQAGNLQTAQWSAPWTSTTVCDDSCPKAKDGHCGDGRSGDGKEVHCDLGTDCSDCGSWTFQVPSESDIIAKPVEQLRARNVSVRVKKTATFPPFLMPYTDPDKDIDLSLQMEHESVYELGLTQMWSKALESGCERPDGSRALVLDIGSSFGWYSLFAAAKGCRVVAWEPVPLFQAFLHYGLQLNNMSGQVVVRDRVVSDVSGKPHNLSVALKGIWGPASVDREFVRKKPEDAWKATFEAVSERVDEIVSEEILATILAVEGFEPQALQSMKGLFDKKWLHNLFMEYSPGAYESQNLWDRLHEMPDMLLDLVDRGFTVLHVNDSLARGPSLLGQASWDGQLPHLEEVTRRNLEYDLQDTQKLKDGIMGCYAPKELERLNKVWAVCNRVPEDLHPKSFRSTFAQKTTIWATAKKNASSVGGTVGIQSLQQKEGEWFGKNPDIGMGGRKCSTISPPNLLLSHRCPCSAPECRREDAMVQAASKQGRMGKLENRALRS